MKKDLPGKDHDGKNYLRQKAEAILHGQQVDLSSLHKEDIQYLLHELQVHQVELTLQNEELRQTRQELETALDRFSDLYNFAPSGYCTLDEKDRIVEANQTLAALLGIERDQLIQKPFVRFIDYHSQDQFYFLRQRTFTSPPADRLYPLEEDHREGKAHSPGIDHHGQVSEMRMVRQTGERIDVQMESVRAPGNKNQMWVMIRDITDQRRLEKQAQERAIQQEVQHRLVDKVEQERQKLARDLHDGPIQDLAAAIFALQGLLLDSTDAETIAQLKAVRQNIQYQVIQLRAFMSELRPTALTKFGLERAIRSHAEIFEKRNPNIRLNLKFPQNGILLPDTTSLVLFRIYQESLVNVLKHAQASVIRVRLIVDDQQVSLEIWDNGKGFEPPANLLDLAQQGRLGLLSMQERAEAVGGTLEINAKTGMATSLRVTVPVPVSDASVREPS